MTMTTVAAAGIETLPVASLALARNIRHTTSREDIEAMKASIRSSGVLQNLIGARRQDGQIAVFAGGTRLQAAKELVKAGEIASDYAVPVMVCPEIDPESPEATAMAMTENMVRAEMDYIDECLAMAELAKARKGEAEIAAIFGYREKTVRERLSIANLIPEAHALVRDKTRALDWARAMTLADASMQKRICEEVRATPNAWATGEVVRRFLTRSTVPAANALFDISTYTGQIVADMFDGDKLADIEAFWDLQNAAIDDLVRDVEAEGWSNVTVVREPFPHWSVEDCTDPAKAEAFIEVLPSGAVSVIRGKAYISETEDAAPTLETVEEDADEVGLAADEVRATPSLLAYAAAHRSAMLQSKLATDFRAALEYQILAMLGDRGVPFSIQTFSMPVDPERQSSRAFRTMQDVGEAVAEALEGEAAATIVRSLDDTALQSLFAMMTAQRAGQPRARSLDDDPEAITNLFGADIAIRDLWTPDEAFLSLMAGEDLRRLASTLLDTGGADVARFTSTPKAHLVQLLHQSFRDAAAGDMTGEVADRLNAWVPGIMTFPAVVRTHDMTAIEGAEDDLDALLFGSAQASADIAAE